jgi:hypothetical protein
VGRYRPGDHALYASNEYDVYGQILIEGIPLDDVLGFNPLRGANWQASADQLVASGGISLGTQLGGSSLSPLLTSIGDAQPEPGKLFDLRTALKAKGVAPSAGDYMTVFAGEIDAVDAAGDAVLLECRDDMAFYADRIIEPPAGDVKGYWTEAATMETVLQSLATVCDSFTDPLGINAPGVIVMGDPEWTVIAHYQKAGISIAEAMHAVILQRGWAFGSRYHSYQGRGTPTAYSPERADLPPSGSTYFMSRIGEITRYLKLRQDRTRVRNVIEMIYGETRTRLSVSDDDSISAYGRRYMLFSEDATSEIDTAEEAERMLNGALADLKDAEVTLDYERTYFPGVEIDDTHVIPANARKHPQLTVGVTGFAHALDWRPNGGTFRSTIRTERRSLAGKARWKKVDPKMVFVSLLEPVGMADEGATWYQVADLTPPG